MDQTFKDKSDLRTREYLKNNHHTLVELSDVQKEKLRKLEMEIANREMEGKKVAEKTGIPENIAALDVVKIAMMLGLVKSKSIREGRETDKTFSILDLFKTKQRPAYEKRQVDFTGIPFYFNHAPNRIMEEEKLDIVSKNVEGVCERMSTELETIVRSYKEQLKTVLVFDCTDDSVDSFRREAINIINDLVDDLIEDGPADVDDILKLLSTVRNRLLGLLPVHSYRQMVMSHIRLMKKLGVDDVLKYLSPIDAFLTMYKNFHTMKCRDTEHQFLLETQIRCFTKDQRLRPFDPSEVEIELCTPSLMFVHIQDIIQYGIIGPYGNNSIGYMNNTFYLLKDIKNDVRMWVVDYGLERTTEWTRCTMSRYIVDTFRTVYATIYGDNKLRDDCLVGRRYFHMAIVNLLFLYSPRLNVFLKYVMQKFSPITPTELDMFNTQRQTRTRPVADYECTRVVALLFDHCDDETRLTSMLTKCQSTRS